MKVIFLRDIPNVAKAGSIREVADGYAVNYLLPKKLAQCASSSVQQSFESKNISEAKRIAEQEADMKALAEKLSSIVLTFKVKTGGGEKLYGSVTSSDIVDELSKSAAIKVDKKKVELPQPIHSLGTYSVNIRLYKDINALVKVNVESIET
jgi:large subunit ribosomal protein L9